MTPFVGRDAELSAVRALADLVRVARGPAVALLVSEPGQGKSRLLAQARKALSLQHSLTIVGYEPEHRVPLGAASEVLRHLAREGPDRVDVPITPADGPNLPSGDAIAPAGRSAAGSLEPVRVFERVLRGIDPIHPTLLSVDDVQWLDDLSLALISYLIRGAVDVRRPLLVLAAGRPSDKLARLERSLSSALSAEALVRIELPPLRRSDGERLLRALVPQMTRQRATAILEEAAGSPFWLEALALSRDEPAEAAEVVRRRIQGAASDAWGVLALLAVLGRPASSRELAAIGGWTEKRIDRSCVELADRAVVVRDAASIRLAHDLIRVAILADLPQAEQRRLHLRIADAIEREAGDDVQLLRSALEHRQQAGRPVIDLALRLAHSPRRRWLGREGAATLAAVGDEADPGQPKLLQLHESVAALASELADHELALRQWEIVAKRTPDRQTRSTAALAAAREAYYLGRAVVARRWLARARATADRETATAIDVLEALIELWLEHRTRNGAQLARRALEKAQELASERGGIAGLTVRARPIYLGALEAAANAALQTEDWAGFRGLVDEWLSATASDEEAHVEALIWQAISRRVDGLFRDALVPLREAWATAQRLILPGAAVNAGYWLATTLADLGELAEAEAIADEAGAMAVRVGDWARIRVRSRSVPYEIGLLRGDWRAATAALLGQAQGVEDPHARFAFHEMLATWLAVFGGPGQAAEVNDQLAETERLVQLAGCPRCRGEVELYRAEALFRTGQRAEARQALKTWRRGRHRPEAWARFQLRRLDGLLEADGGSIDRGVGILHSEVQEMERIGRRVEAVITRLDIGRLLLDRDRGAAADALRAGGASADAIGAHTLAAAAERELRRLGVRTWRRGAPAGASGGPLERLTDREREVALLVAAGLPNPEIASRLFLSRKTIERHVSNVLARLGVANRTELASVLREETY